MSGSENQPLSRMTLSERDVLWILPEAAGEKLRSLRLGRDDARALLMKVSADRETLRAELTGLKIRRHQLSESRDFPNRFLKEEALKEIDAEVAKAEVELKRSEDILAPRETRWEGLSHLVLAIEDWLTGIGKTDALKMMGAVRPSKPKSGGNFLEEIETFRRRIREGRADLDKIAAAPIPSADAKKVARKQIANLAQRGTPDCFRLIEAGEEIRWPPLQLEQAQFVDLNRSPVFAHGELPDGLAFLAWLNHDSMVKAIEREIDAAADDTNALTAEERVKRREIVSADILANEREEEAAIEFASSKGVNVMRRIDADPRAVLGLSGDLPAPK